jgi:hypothetical protein
MATVKAHVVALFPTSGAIDEELQIGRSAEIEQLTISALAGENRIIAEPRRVGKSSVVKAARNRIIHQRDERRTVLSVDLRDGLSTPAELADELFKQARQQGAGGARGVIKHLERGLEDVARTAAEVDLGKIAEQLGAQEVSELARGALSALRNAQRDALHDVLKLIDDYGRAKPRPTIILVDEVQEAENWVQGDIVAKEIAVAAKRDDSTVSFVLTGSKVSSVRAMFEPPGAPLVGVVRPLPLPRIDDEVWRDGLTDRYQQAGLTITREQVDTILIASDGHPLKTMLICRETLDWILPTNDAVTDLAVRQAIIVARGNPGWRQM